MNVLYFSKPGNTILFWRRLVLPCLVLSGFALARFLVILNISYFLNKYGYPFPTLHLNIEILKYIVQLITTNVANSAKYVSGDLF